MPLSYQQKFRVFQFECDPWDRMTPAAVLRRVQEIGTEQCETLGIDEEFYKKHQMVFLLSKVSLEIYRMPTIEEEITIETRAYGLKRALYHRVTSLHAPDGSKLCEADSRWILVSTQNNHILRKPVPEFEPFFGEEPGAEEHEMDMPKPENLASVAELVANYSLCDRNGHINNAAYAEIMANHIPLAQFRQGAPKKLLLSYKTEIPLEAEFTLARAELDAKSYYFQASAQGKKNFEAAVWF